METPKGLEELKKRQHIPVYIEGEKEPRYVYEVPEIAKAAELIQQMAKALERVSEYGNNLEKSMRKSDIARVEQTLKSFREWK